MIVYNIYIFLMTNKSKMIIKYDTKITYYDKIFHTKIDNNEGDSDLDDFHSLGWEFRLIPLKLAIEWAVPSCH